MYEADACILQASAFFRCRKITDANVLNGFFKRLETYPEMKTERFTAVKRSVSCMSIIGFACAGASCCIAQKSG